jgi:Cft2 family RNA processing exonuclease
VLQLLLDNVFNGIVWPDFSKLISPLTKAPAVIYRPVTPGKKVMINDVGLTAVNVHHLIPAAGVIVEIGGQAIAFTGDTGPTSEIWKRTNKTPNVVAIVTEASFPNDSAIARRTKPRISHRTPSASGAEEESHVDAPVYASSPQDPVRADIESQIRNLRDRGRGCCWRKTTPVDRGIGHRRVRNRFPRNTSIMTSGLNFGHNNREIATAP